MVKKPVDPPTRDELVIDWMVAICKSGLFAQGVAVMDMDETNVHHQTLFEAYQTLGELVKGEAARRGTKWERKP